MRVAVVTFDGCSGALSYVLPHGEEAEYTRRALAHVVPFVVDAASPETPPL